MTRLANIEKAGYFPLPENVADLIASHLSAPHGGRVLDSCAGEGAALVALAERVCLDPFGVELHEGRAKAARAAVARLVTSQNRGETAVLPDGHILHDSYQNLVTSHGGYNLLYLNPPYDHDEAEGEGRV